MATITKITLNKSVTITLNIINNNKKKYILRFNIFKLIFFSTQGVHHLASGVVFFINLRDGVIACLSLLLKISSFVSFR